MEIKEQLSHGLETLEERVRPELDAAKEKLSDLNGQVVSFITAHPGRCILGALALGYVVAKIARGFSRHGT